MKKRQESAAEAFLYHHYLINLVISFQFSLIAKNITKIALSADFKIFKVVFQTTCLLHLIVIMEKETRKSFSLDCAPELSISGKYIYPKVAFNTLLTDLRINVKISRIKQIKFETKNSSNRQWTLGYSYSSSIDPKLRIIKIYLFSIYTSNCSFLRLRDASSFYATLVSRWESKAEHKR